MAEHSTIPVLGARPTATSLVALVAFCGVFLYLVYLKLLPKPIEGIPYNKTAAHSLFGDIPEMMAYMSRTQEIWAWIAEQNTKHQSAIVQVFARPFAKPWVILSDHREAQDILLRRTKEFDRSSFTGDLFGGMTPDFHIHYLSSDPRFKLHRNLLKDLMTPAFLHEVAGPQIYANDETFMKLWEYKAEAAQGRAFQADEDIYNTALDVIFATSFGLDPKRSNSAAHLQQLTAAPVQIAQSQEEPVDFLHARRPIGFQAITTLTESLEACTKSPVPRLAHWILRQMPYMRKARADKEKLFTDMIRQSIKRIESGEQVRGSALDDILMRETAIAKKEGRPPIYYSRTIYDEVSHLSEEIFITRLT